MRIELRLPPRVTCEVRDYDESLDDIRSILSDVCHAVERDGRAEQGIERKLVFTPVEERYNVVCESWHRSWQPNPSVERSQRAELLTMLKEVDATFMAFLRNSAPQLAEHPWVVSWQKR